MKKVRDGIGWFLIIVTMAACNNADSERDLRFTISPEDVNADRAREDIDTTGADSVIIIKRDTVKK